MSRYSRFPAVNRQEGDSSPAPESSAPSSSSSGEQRGSSYDIDIIGMTVSEVEDWVGEDEERAAYAVAEEQRSESPRKGVLALG